MLHHGCVTFQVLRLVLLLYDIALQSYDLYILCHLFKVDCSGCLLLELDSFNSDARKALFIFVVNYLKDPDIFFFLTRVIHHIVFFFFALDTTDNDLLE